MVSMSDRHKYVLLGEWKKEEHCAFVCWPHALLVLLCNQFLTTPPYRYFTPEVWNLIVVETNRYAAQCRGAQPLTHTDSRRPWHNVTIEEMRAYLGVCMIMGITILPRIEMYWSQKHPLLCQPLSQVMFEQISRYLHICNISEQVPPIQTYYTQASVRIQSP